MALSYKEKISPFSAQQIEAIARILGDTDRGLKGSQIGYILQQCTIPDPTPEMTKWKRLFNAFIEFQNLHGVGNHIIVLITRVMAPTSYIADRELFQWRKEQLNVVLSFCGYSVGDDGKVRRVSKATTLDEAFERAKRMESQLRQRNVHNDVLKFCNAAIVAENYFHAVFEAMKSITAKIRNLSGLSDDGAQLVDAAFGLGKSGSPILSINSLATETELGEQKGFVNLLKGLYGVIRNPLAHNPKIEWDMTEQDALDILTTISLVHRKLDSACIRR